MEDRIAQMIKDGDLDQAKGEILNIEDCIRLETSAYNRKALLDRVKRLKEVYNENNIVDVSEISFKKPVQFEERRNSISSTKDKIYVRDIEHGTIRLGSCIEAVIERCSNTVFEHFECQRSVFFVDIKNCQISCSGQQIRIDNCNNIELTVCTSTGVFLQNSAGIVIKRYGDSEDNKFANVYDFSNPLDSGNFKIL